MGPQRLLILIGICLGSGAGIMGAYVGWRRAAGTASRRLMVPTAVLTLIFAVGLGVVALVAKATWRLHLLLLLPPAILGYWFLKQILAIGAVKKDDTSVQ